MKTEDNAQASLGEGMRLIFDQESSSSRSSSRSSSTDSSYSSSQSSCSSYGSHGSRRQGRRHRSRSSASESGSSDKHSRTRSRSHPRCHRALDRSHCRRHCCSPPRRYRARSRSFSPSPDRSSQHRRHRDKAYSRSGSHSSRERSSRYSRRSRSRSTVYRYRFVGRYRCRFSQSPRRRYRDYRSRSRSPQRSAVRLSQKEKTDLLNIARENAVKILGVQNLELPASVKSLELQTMKQEDKQNVERNIKERVSADPVPLKKPAQKLRRTDSLLVALKSEEQPLCPRIPKTSLRTERWMGDTDEDDANVARMSPTRKPITFSISNTVAKPSSSPTYHVTESKVTSRADSMGNRKPYGQWVPVKNSRKKQ